MERFGGGDALKKHVGEQFEVEPRWPWIGSYGGYGDAERRKTTACRVPQAATRTPLGSRIFGNLGDIRPQHVFVRGFTLGSFP